MPSLSKTSLQHLSTCHPDLQKLINTVVQYYDISVICGYRDQAAQDDAVNRGMSKVNFPKSKHNSVPSMAVDIAPYPLDWNDRNKFYHMVGFVKGVADILGIKIRCGADFNMDNNLKNDGFVDLPHIELVGVKK